MRADVALVCARRDGGEEKGEDEGQEAPAHTTGDRLRTGSLTIVGRPGRTNVRSDGPETGRPDGRLYDAVMRVRVLAAALAALAIVGCGGDDDDDEGSATDVGVAQISAVVDDLQNAAKAGDTVNICDELFTRNLKISIRNASGQPCAEEVADNVAPRNATFKVSDIRVGADRATAKVVDGKGVASNLVFLREKARWRIARIGG